MFYVYMRIYSMIYIDIYAKEIMNLSGNRRQRRIWGRQKAGMEDGNTALNMKV